MAATVGPDGRTQYVYTISGVRVEFPVKAYPSQIAMMDKVIRGLQRGHHCLLESPTGSGKTLALLCASLAWQRAETENVRKHNEAVEAATRSSMAHKINIQAQEKAAVKIEKKEDPVTANLTEDDSDDDFQPSKPRKRTKISTSPPTEKPDVKKEPAVAVDEPVEATSEFDNPTMRRQKIPRIYFGTRTHKQISQVVKEFRRTSYCKTPMCVLASREHTCIHPEVSRSSNKNEGCKELTDAKKLRSGGGCQYYLRASAKLKTQGAIKSYGYENGWDIEDLIKLGRQLRACPYYSSRQLMEQAQIVFSPYNYLIDPRIRQSMKIELRGNIIMLDEAHNIEDSAREAASGTFSQESFRLALVDCEMVANRSETMKREIEELAKFCSYMMGWLNRQATSLKSVGIDKDVHIMSGTEFVASLSLDGYGPEKLTDIKAIIDYIFNEQMESEWADKEKNQEPQLSGATQQTLEGFLIIVQLLLVDNQIHREDYRAVVVRSVERRRNKESASNWFNKNNSTSQLSYSLHLWCLNPAVVLKDVRHSSRSIIVTSGTLSPMSSYQTELDIDFKISLEANHVIPPSRVWIGSVSHGPNNVLLNGTFRSTGTFDYQDELGRLLLNVCQVVPHGVLCFLPSYSLLEKLVTRWNSTGLMNHLGNRKTIVCESRESAAFEETLKSYYEAIEASERDAEASENGPNGALMLAVCRGKVSEGLDFADNNARAVVCVGIPFPNVKDTQVELKRQYNDKRAATSRILNGAEWYEIQAFRALNQALGRCIRHRNDWGAILLVDDRFGKIPRYVGGLSKWVRGSVRHFNNCGEMMHSVKEFTKTLVADDAAVLASQLASQTMTQSSQSSGDAVASPYFSVKDEPVEASGSSLPIPLKPVQTDDDVIFTPTKKPTSSWKLKKEPDQIEMPYTSINSKPPIIRNTFQTLLGHTERLTSRIPVLQSPEISEDDSLSDIDDY